MPPTRSPFPSLRKPPPVPWLDGEKIPWHEPGFSQRMLAAHLSQEHDWASRRLCLIDQHVGWITKGLPAGRCRILDLACGPGLYLQRLADAGHVCFGIDYSPASIAHARAEAVRAGRSIDYLQGDLRQTVWPEGMDLVLMAFGEINVFRPEDAASLITKAACALKPGGRFVLEASTFESIRAEGLLGEALSEHLAGGLFSDAPHQLLEEHFWDEGQAVASTRYTVRELSTGMLKEFGSASKAYSTEAFHALFEAAGFAGFECLPSEAWPSGAPFDGKLFVMTGVRHG